MADNNLTVLQRLTKMFKRSGGAPLATTSEIEHSYNLNTREILRTHDKNEYDLKKLQLQQSQYLLDKWIKIDNELYNKATVHETTRLSAYYDFESMEFCLVGDTKIATPQGFITIKELADKGRENEFYVYSYDHKKEKIVPAIARNAHYTRDEMTYKVIFDDGSYIIGTKEHRLMKRDGSYVQISDLKGGESMMPFYRKSFYNNKTFVLNHKVVNVVEYGIVPVYDITVPKYENFATDTIFSHNCPEISAALDIYSEEATTPSERGHMLSIYSESKRVKTTLTHLFNNVLDINTNLQMWTRNTCKYGDNFVYLKIDPDRGIVGCYQLPNIEIERLEGQAFKNAQANSVQKIDIKKEDLGTRQVVFRWKDKNMDFQPWEIAHFRLLGDDRKLPYGTSMLDKCRRIWKQLVLAEDAMLIYRTSRAPERRVFKVFVGNMDDADVEAYVQRVANKFKRDQISDPRNGNVDTRYNQMAVDQDFFIPVRDPSQASPIETLPGAQNLGEIQDIEYIQKKMLAALRIPKAFLGFEEVVGEGKGLSMMDIRFARTINRIQKSMIQELNKIAIVHLFILGLEDELDNFTLGLTNPSTQSDLLKIEQWKEKVLLYKDAVGDGQSIAPTSHTFAKKFFLGMSDEEVILDLQQQKVERGLTEELANSKDIKTGIFNKINQLYSTGESPSGEEGEEGGTTGGGGGGSFSSGGGSLPDLGGLGDEGSEAPPEGGEGTEGGIAPPPEGAEGEAAPPELGGETSSEEQEPPQLSEEKVNNLTRLMEKRDLKNTPHLDLNRGRQKLNEIQDELDKLING